MKFPFLLTFLMFFSFQFSFSQKGEVRFEISKDRSKVTWTTPYGEKKELTGSFKVKEGYAVMVDGKLTQLVVYVDTRSFGINNMPEEKDRNKLTEYVASEDFLNSKNMDFAVFKAYKITELKGSKEGNYEIEGSLVMKAYQNTVHFPAMIEVKKDKLSGTAKVSMNRSLWHLNSPLQEDGTGYPVTNNVSLYIELEGEAK